MYAKVLVRAHGKALPWYKFLKINEDWYEIAIYQATYIVVVILM